MFYFVVTSWTNHWTNHWVPCDLRWHDAHVIKQHLVLSLDIYKIVLGCTAKDVCHSNHISLPNSCGHRKISHSRYFQYQKKKQERLKHRNTLGCLDQYAAQNSKYVRPPIPSQPPTQKVFFQWHTQYEPTMKYSHLWNSLCQGAVSMAVLWIGSLPQNSLNSPNLQTSWSH